MAERVQVETLEDVEHLEGDEALGVRRDLVDGDVLVGRRDRLDPVGVVRLQIVESHEATLALNEFRDGARDLSAIERVGAFGRDLSERAREVGLAKELAVTGRAAVHEVRLRRRRLARELLLGSLPVRRDDLGDRKPVLGVADGRLEKLCKALAPEARPELLPAVERSWNGYRVDTVARHLVASHAPEPFRGCQRAGAARCVEAVELLGLVVPDEGEEVAADAAHHGLDDVEHRGGGDGSVDGVSAFLQHAQTRGRGERLARGDDAVGREHRRAPERRAFRGPVGGGGFERAQGEQDSGQGGEYGLLASHECTSCGTLSGERARVKTTPRALNGRRCGPGSSPTCP